MSALLNLRSYFTIFGFNIYFYGILVAAGILVAFIIACILWKKKGYRENDPYLVLLIAMPVAFLGARIMYVAFHDGSMNFFDFRGGGLAIYGGLIFGALAVVCYSIFIRKSTPFAVTDIIVVGLILAQSIGRWGNFFNGEAYGLGTGDFSFPLLTVTIDGSNHLATFFYESLLNFIGFFVLWQEFKRSRKIGTTTAMYCIYYGTVRTIIEPLRLDSLMMGSGDVIINRVSFLISLLLIVAGIAILLMNRKDLISQRHHGLLEINGPKKRGQNDTEHTTSDDMEQPELVPTQDAKQAKASKQKASDKGGAQDAPELSEAHDDAVRRKTSNKGRAKSNTSKQEKV